MSFGARAALTLAVSVAVGAAVIAHHGASDYDVEREIRVSGAVREWRWTQPHTWVYLTVSPPDGAPVIWEGEGPPLSWAEARGWSRTMLQPGERLTLVMYPSRRKPSSGLVKRIERANGQVVVVSRPWLDR